jgi:hypothetical protein
VQPGDVLAIIKGRVQNPGTAERIRVIIQQVYNHACPRRSNFDPPCRLNFDPGLVAGIA